MMTEIVICVEINNFWINKQKEKGEVPFAAFSDMLSQKYPAVRISASENKLEIGNVQSPGLSADIREAIKNFFTEKYQMSIVEGDYNIITKSHCVSEQLATQEYKTNQLKADTAQAGDATDNTAGSLSEAEKYIRLPELDAFLEEFGAILKNTKKFKISKIVWSTNILLSMDSGYGISTVNQRIADMLSENGFLYNNQNPKQIAEYVIPEESKEADQYWETMLNRIEKCYLEEKETGRRSSNAPLIYCIDLSECLGGMNEKKLYDNLHKLAKIKGSFLYSFRIPYVESIALGKMKGILSDMFMIRQIVVPPYSNDVLVQYLKNQLHENQITLQGSIDELLEKLITMEKQDGHFHGLKTIDRLMSDIIYNKLSVEQTNEYISVDADDLMKMYHLSEMEVDDPEEAINQLCGMENVKRTIDEVIAQIQLYNELKSSGKKLSAPTMHMRFVGNPGTGKTTVARLVAQLYKEKGILSKGHFFEIKARDLCGRYVGETAPKTSRYCKDALGSVLFIDEAYSLYRGKDRNDFGQEAIETLITEMENNRDNLIVIMAGYKNEMNELLRSNPGLASRIPYEVEFRNYTKDELIDIFYTMLGDSFSYSDDFDRAVREFVYSIPDSVLDDEEFANARMIRNLYERIWSKAAYRRSISKEKEIILTEEDVQRAVADEEFQRLLVSNKNTIGF